MRILVVEDERIVAQRLIRMVREILADQVKSVRHVEYFSDALAYLQTHPVDLVLLDLNLNGMDGFRILSEAVAGSFQTVIVPRTRTRQSALLSMESWISSPNRLQKNGSKRRLTGSTCRRDRSRQSISRSRIPVASK